MSGAGLPPTIQVVNYWGDLDDLNEVNIIGPYDTVRQRDEDLRRLAGLPGVYGSAHLLPSTIPVECGHLRATPAAVADITDLDGLVGALIARQ